MADLIFVPMVFMGGPLLTIVINNLLPRDKAERWCLPLGLAAATAQIAAAVICISLLWQYSNTYIDFSFLWDMLLSPGSARFSVDMFSLLVLTSIGMVAAIALLTGWQTIERQKLNFCNLLMIAVIGMNGLAIVGDLFSLYVFLEVTGVSSFVLIGMNRDKRGLEGAFKYLAMSAIASAFLLAALAFIFMQVGSLRFAEVSAALTDWKSAAQPALLIVAFVLFIVAFSIKAGLFPFHGWLPDAYQSAPPAVSVLLAGIVTKGAGVYAIVRMLTGVLVGIDNMHTVFAILGLFSILYGALAAIGQNDIKRILAYSSISQIGYIVLGAASGSALGLAGAALHFFNHATFKTTLFVNAAALERQLGTTDIEAMPGGLTERMPLTGLSSMLAFFSAAGIPPLAGFWSKVLIILAVWQAGYVSFAAVALAASIFTAAYFLRLQRKVFFGKAEDDSAEVREIGGPIALSELLLSIITVGFGLLFPATLLFLQAQGLL